MVPVKHKKSDKSVLNLLYLFIAVISWLPSFKFFLQLDRFCLDINYCVAINVVDKNAVMLPELRDGARKGKVFQLQAMIIDKKLKSQSLWVICR